VRSLSRVGAPRDAIAMTLAVQAITDQRRIPASAATVIARTGPNRSSTRGPATTNTAISAATNSDHGTLAVGGDIPAASQRIIAKASRMAWLPRKNAAITISNLNCLSTTGRAATRRPWCRFSERRAPQRLHRCCCAGGGREKGRTEPDDQVETDTRDRGRR
jgi:hypothetical protein